jgi:hypothetical protein
MQMLTQMYSKAISFDQQAFEEKTVKRRKPSMSIKSSKHNESQSNSSLELQRLPQKIIKFILLRIS